MAPRSRAAQTLRKVKKDLKLKVKPKKKNGVGMRRRDATIVLAQGAVAPPRRNFGSRKTNGGANKASNLRKCLDARIPRTLGLPRAVGPYTIIRTTSVHSIASDFVMFAPFWSDYHHRWYNWAGVFGINASADVTSASNTHPITLPTTSLGQAAELVPASLTVQVMNPASLQNATGLFAMCRVNQQMDLGSSPAGLTYREMASRVVSYYSPRMLTGGKLALRGVKCSSYPLDMVNYANFSPMVHHSPVVQWDTNIRPAALAPICFVQSTQAGESPISMDFMVTMEWRVRFDPGNPATASHEYHATLSDDSWNALMKAEAVAGHAVHELSEDVALNGALG